MWDQVDRDVLMASDGKDLHTYVHSHTTIHGSMVGRRTDRTADSPPLQVVEPEVLGGFLRPGKRNAPDRKSVV